MTFQLNHGIALSADGKWLYASTDDKVYRWPYSSSSSSLDSRRTIVNNMTNSGHTTRTLLLPPSHPDLLLVSRGSQGNDDSGAREIGSGRSQLRSFDLSSVPDDDDADPIDYITGDVLAWGLRNSVGVAQHPDGGIWSVENSVDNLERDGEDVHRDNPGEELNFHGFLNRSTDETGANYGYPMCVALWDTEGFPERGGMRTGDQFATGDGDADDDECRDDYMKPRLTFQAHVAPLDIKFSKNGSEAFVTFHGSCKSCSSYVQSINNDLTESLHLGNREEPVGYKVVSIDFSSSGQPSVDSASTSAANTILSNKDLSRCPDDCFRPVGLAWDKDGKLFMSSDSTGEIFVLHRNASGSDSGSDSGSGSSGGGDDDAGSSSGGDDDDEDGVLSMQQFAPRSAAWAVSFAALVIGMLLA